MIFLIIKIGKFSFNQCLVYESINIRDVIYLYKIKFNKLKKEFGFDVILIFIDEICEIWVEDKLCQKIKVLRLSKVLELLKNNYDYILIDFFFNW